MAKKNKSKRTARATKQKKGTVSPAKQIPTEGVWERQKPVTRHLICLGLLIAISFTLFAPIHFKGKSLFAFDTVSFKAMSNEMTKYEQETGDKALWSPNPFGGMPGYMIASPLEVVQADDIPRALRYVIWPSSHFIFLLIGMYLLAFYLVKDHWSSMLAAIGYGLTTYVPIIIVAGHNSKFITMAFAPWLLLGFIHALRKPGLLSSLLFSIALAVNLRAGHVQITYYVAFLMGIWWIVEGVIASRAGSIKNFSMATLWLGLGSILGLLMIAQPYLSNFEYKEFTIRGAAPGGEASGLSWDYAMNWSQGFGELLTLLISDAYGGASSAAYWGPKPPTGGPHYVGGIILVLALFASFTIRTKEVLALSISAFVMTLFSLGRHFEVLNRPMYEYFPLFSSFRVPETWLSIVALILALMAAYGLSKVLQSSREQGPAFSPVIKSFAIGIGIVLLLLMTNNAILPFEREGEVQQLMQQVARQNNVDVNNPQVATVARQAIEQIKEERSDKFTNDAIRTFLFLLAGGAVLFFYQRQRVPALIAGIAIGVFVLFDLGGVWQRYFNEDRLGNQRVADELVREYAFDRYLIDKKDELGGNGHFRVLSLEGSPTEIARPAYHYETLSGYHGAKLRLYQDYLENILFDPSGLPNSNGLDIMNTRYVVAGGPYPGAREVFRDDQTGMVVSERPTTPSRAFFVGDLEVIESPDETWERLRDPAFNPRRTAILPAEPGFVTTAIDSSSIASAVLKQHTPHEISWDVKTDADRLLVISEVYYPPGWKATLNGEEVPILRANYLLRGVFVEAGEHELIMTFDPQSYRIGYLLTLLSTLLVYGGVIALVGMGYMRSKSKQEERPPTE